MIPAAARSDDAVRPAPGEYDHDDFGKLVPASEPEALPNQIEQQINSNALAIRYGSSD